MSTRDAQRAGVRRWIFVLAEGEWLTYASAISFQLCHAMIPVALAALALLGFLDLQDTWTSEVAPRLERELPGDIFGAVNDAVTGLLDAKREFWLTFGLGFALWQLSGAVRATMGALNHLYDIDEPRGMLARFGVSFLLTLAVSGACLAAVAGAEIVPRVLAGMDIGVIPRVALRGVFLVVTPYLVLYLLMRFGPAVERSIDGRSVSSLLVIGGWLVVTLVFRWYVTSVAQYQSVFGSLASIFVLMTYVYLSVAVFLFGAKLDAIARNVHPRAEALRSGGT